MFVNGKEIEKVTNCYSAAKNNNTYTQFLIGYCIQSPIESIATSIYRLSALMFFQGLTLSKEKAMLMYILGPNTDNLCECDNLQNNVGFVHSALIKHILESGLDVESVLERINDNYRILRVGQLNYYLLYFA